MTVTETKLKGCYLIEPRVFEDERGYFFESFNHEKLEAQIGKIGSFVQDNQSFSTYGTLRGLHFQKGEHAQAKLVRAIAGEVLDIAVDIREGSATYGQWVSALLSAENNHQLYIPRGFAHGFSVLSASAIFAYKCDNYYHKEAEGGFRFDDPSFNFDWQLPKEAMILSEKDMELPFFK